MKRTIVTTLMAVAATLCLAQSLVIGEKPSDLKIKEYVVGGPAKNTLPTLIEFFVSNSAPSKKSIIQIDQFSRDYRGRMNVLLIAREDRNTIAPMFPGTDYAFSVALDDQEKTFTGYGVDFVPFSVLLDGKGRVLWHGNAADLSKELLDQYLK